VGPRAGRNNVERRKFLTLPGLELRPLSRRARSQSLYRLRNLKFTKFTIQLTVCIETRTFKSSTSLHQSRPLKRPWDSLFIIRSLNPIFHMIPLLLYSHSLLEFLNGYFPRAGVLNLFCSMGPFSSLVKPMDPFVLNA
jgi:hypothetical protein